MKLSVYVSTAALMAALLTLPALPGKAQGGTTKTNAVKRQKAAPGTYQLQVFTLKDEIAFSDEVLYQVEAMRHATEERYLHLGDRAGVLIPSRKVISAPGFQPLKEKVIRVQ